MTGYLLPTISTVRQYQTHVHPSSSTPGRSCGRSITVTAEADATAPSTSQPSSPWPSAEDAPCIATLLEGPVGAFLGTSLPWTHRLHAHCHTGSGFVLKSSFPAVPTACSHKFPSAFSLGFLSFSTLPRMSSSDSVQPMAKPSPHFCFFTQHGDLCCPSPATPKPPYSLPL